MWAKESMGWSVPEGTLAANIPVYSVISNHNASKLIYDYKISALTTYSLLMYRKDECAYLVQGSFPIKLQVKYIQVTGNVYVSTKDYLIHDTITT